MKMSVGDKGNLFISGRSASGLRPLFPQPDLRVNVEGNSVQMQGIQFVEAVQPGNSQLRVDWKNGQAQRTVSVDVDNSAYTGLAIDPRTITLGVGEGVSYQVTALRGGRIYVLTPQDGLQLTVNNPNVAEAHGNMIYGRSPGRTGVTARFMGMAAEAEVDVVTEIIREPEGPLGPGTGPVITKIWPPHIDPPEGPWLPVRPPIIEHGEVSGLIFDPPSVRLASAGGAVPVRVYEVYSTGGTGREVTNDPALQLSSTSQLITLSRGEGGAYMIQPTGKEGITSVRAEMGSLSAIPLRVQVGDVGGPENAFLSVLPSPLQMTVGETATLDAVKVVPQSGVMPFDVSYRVSPVENTGVVTVDGANTIRANATGSVRLQVSSVDPTGAYDNLSTYITVNVTPPLALSMMPTDCTVRVGELTPSFIVTARDETGASFTVPAVISSTDPMILEGTEDPTRFRAVSMGKTQVRALYGGKELFATVSVAGERFVNVDGELNESPGSNSFSVTLSVMANAAAGALEYRVYERGRASSENWVPAAGQSVTLSGPAMQYNPDRAYQYTLVVESRPAGGGETQEYPYNFRLGGIIKKVE